MCATCGCDGVQHEHEHEHEHAHAHEHGHTHAHEHAHEHEHTHDHHHHAHAHAHTHHHHAPARAPVLLELEARVLAKNDARAAQNRAWLAERRILALNLVSSPGAGKTTLLVRTIRDLAAAATPTPICVIEGDQETARDAERIRATGAAAVQVNTGTGCHLDAEMVARGLTALDPPAGSLLMIENVGNLVCPALFDLGERAKVVVLSVTEGDDKPLKYPHMFRAATLVLVHKIDLLPYVDFDVSAAIDRARHVNPRLTALTVSAKTGEGLADWYAWIRAQHARVDASPLPPSIVD